MEERYSIKLSLLMLNMVKPHEISTSLIHYQYQTYTSLPPLKGQLKYQIGGTKLGHKFIGFNELVIFYLF